MTVAPLNTANKSPAFGEGEGFGEPVGDALGLGFGEPVGDALGDGFGEPVGDALGLGFGEPVGEADGDGFGDALGDGFGEPLGETDGDGLAETMPNVPVKMLVAPCLTAIGFPLLTFGTLCPLFVSMLKNPTPLLMAICPTKALLTYMSSTVPFGKLTEDVCTLKRRLPLSSKRCSAKPAGETPPIAAPESDA